MSNNHRRIAGAPGRNGLAEAAELRRAWDDRPIPWWDADRHIAEQHAAWGRPLIGTEDD